MNRVLSAVRVFRRPPSFLSSLPPFCPPSIVFRPFSRSTPRLPSNPFGRDRRRPKTDDEIKREFHVELTIAAVILCAVVALYACTARLTADTERSREKEAKIDAAIERLARELGEETAYRPEEDTASKATVSIHEYKIDALLRKVNKTLDKKSVPWQ